MSSTLLRPLSLLYRALLASKNGAYDLHFRQPQRLAQPVVSIGNLSVGGAGKTPLVIHLARLLDQRGIPVDVLSRGYGRIESHEIARVNIHNPQAAAAFGDEPLLIAASAGCPVYVGASRYRAGLLAERDAPRLHLLDDGFQHRRLFRDVDIVVLHRSDFSGRLLPEGRLREPLSSLGRASVLVLRAEDAALEAALRRRRCTAPVWIVHRAVVPPAAGPYVAFCGIARPQEFFSALAGKDLLATRAFRDHHRYSDADVRALAELARVHGARAIVATEKDLVRLSPTQREVLSSRAVLAAARLEVRLEDEAAALAQLLSMLPPGSGPSSML